jgi:hypothetical protein
VIVLIPLHDLLLGNELWRQLAQSLALWFTFGSLAASHFWRAFRMGYDTMPDKELKQKVRWDLYLLILRAIAMFFMAAHGLYFILVPLMALLLSYLEIWPERAIGAVFGDPSRLWEYDPGNPTKLATTLTSATTDGICGIYCGHASQDSNVFWH